MRWMPRIGALVGMLLAMMMVAMEPAVSEAQVGTTQLADTVYRADGTAASGTVLVSWGAFTTVSGQPVAAGSTSVALGPAGALSVRLAPNAGATPIGSYYTAVYHLDDGRVSREYWVLPVSAGAVGLAAVRNSVLPTSVAMQTVSKSYVDTAIAAAVTGHPLDSSPYVLKAGDTMTGPLVLPADPASANQAADKHYVDASVSAVASGVAEKVSTVPPGTQTVVQPVGTQLQVNELNGVEYASQYQTGRLDNGVANATSSPDCANGCEVKVEQTYGPAEFYTPSTWNSHTHVKDARLGEQRDSYYNPESLFVSGQDAGQVVDVVSTRTAQDVFSRKGVETGAFSIGLAVRGEGLAGGSNLFPVSTEPQVPYFKSTYSALKVDGYYNTLGQHILAPLNINCYGVGDCLVGSQVIVSSGGYRDEGDEGAHPFDLVVSEDSHVFTGRCAAGCTPSSTNVTVGSIQFAGTQGEGRFLLDLNPNGILTGGTLTGEGISTEFPVAIFSGTNFPVSIFFQTAAAATSQVNDVAPGTVTLPVATSALPSGYATNTAAAPAASGIACVADKSPRGSFLPPNYEMVNYTVVDGTHIQLSLRKVHGAGSTIAIGGLCGYGLEQTVDTVGGIRQVFPVVGAFSATGIFYAGADTPIVGRQTVTSGFLNVNLAVAGIARSGNVVTATTAGNLPVDLNGLTLTVAGVADSSYNGSFVVTTTGPNTLTYSQAGANSTSTGGTLGVLTGGYALYPMAEVLSVFNPATHMIDGQMTLAPNLVHWAANDPVEEPHYYQVRVAGDVEEIVQTSPRPVAFQQSGKSYGGTVGPGVQGWVIFNSAPATQYLGNGGTHTAPDYAFGSAGVWTSVMDAEAGERSIFNLHCNSHGCGKWNSSYDLFELDSAAGQDQVNYSPAASAMTVTMRGTSYGFTPTGFNAGTINVGTLNAANLTASLSGTSITSGTIAAARLPLFGASGAGHAPGIVPDPGPVAGTARFLREDGTFAVPAGGASGGSGGSVDGTAVGAVTPVLSLASSGPVTLATATAATATLNQNSPVLALNGMGWTGSSSAADGWTVQSVLGSGVSPSNTLTLTHPGTGHSLLRLRTPDSNDAVLVIDTAQTSSAMIQHNYEATQLTSSQGWKIVQTGVPMSLGISSVLTFGTSQQFQVDGNGVVTAPNVRTLLAGTTGTIGGSALAAGNCTTGTAAVTGATVGAAVAVAASDGSLPSGLVLVRGAVSAADTVTVQVCAVSAVTPAAVAYNVRVIE